MGQPFALLGRRTIATANPDVHECGDRQGCPVPGHAIRDGIVVCDPRVHANGPSVARIADKDGYRATITVRREHVTTLE
jgi:hypothetical protein